MAYYPSYNMYPNQMQYYQSLNYSSYYGSPYGMTTGGLFYPDGKTQEAGEKTESGGEKIGAKDALDFLKPLFEKLLELLPF
ncbi:hypothetical protein I4U23_015270 [Adineta vaga]|nr:hypothetical protein I4U23_015270 [Adineta vaga]